MITVFSAMRPFVDSIGRAQLNAVRSWLEMRPQVEVVLVNDEEGTTPAAVAGLDVQILTEVRRSRLGAPLLDDLLRIGAEAARGDVLAFNTADVLLPPDFSAVAEALHRAMEGRDFFASGSRFDLLKPTDLAVGEDGWYDRLQGAVRSVGTPHGHTALDLWVYPRTLRWDAPPMPIGRGGMDGWAIWKMKTVGVPFIDFSHDVLLVHQFHDRPARRNPLFHEERLECIRLFPTMRENAMSLLDADWLFEEGRLRRPTGLRRIHASLSLSRPYRFLVGQRRRLMRPHLYGPDALRSRA